MAPYGIVSKVHQRSISYSGIPSLRQARAELQLEHLFGDPGAFIINSKGERVEWHTCDNTPTAAESL